MIQNDSRKVKKGDTFIAIKGVLNDGHDYINEALQNGAKKIICEHGEGTIVKDTKQYLVNYLKKYYYKKIKHLKIIGITGTNGKTTTAYLIYQALNILGIKTAYIGTLGFYLNDKHYPLDNTTPDLLKIYQMLLEAKDCEYVVMEVSSQGISYGRVESLQFDYAIFTNLTQDHLDYHKTMENYALAKQQLFKQLKSTGIGIVNIDSDYSDLFMTKQTITYGFNNSDYQITENKIDINGSKFKVNKKKYKSSLIGKYNLYNLTALIILLKQIGIKNHKLYRVIKKLKHAKGRMDTITYKHNIIIIDYAHTPDAVLNVINSVKKIGKRIITIIGCGGNRDKDKRAKMGEIATTNSSYVIFTNDNPRLEDPDIIMADITSNLKQNNYEIEKNRQKAINKGIQKLKKNDILLILGKGCENYQVIGHKKYHFNDLEEVNKIIGR